MPLEPVAALDKWLTWRGRERKSTEMWNCRAVTLEMDYCKMQLDILRESWSVKLAARGGIRNELARQTLAWLWTPADQREAYYIPSKGTITQPLKGLYLP